MSGGWGDQRKAEKPPRQVSRSQRREQGEAESRGGSPSKRTSSRAEKGSLDLEPQPSKSNSRYYSPMGGTSSQTKNNPPQSEMQGHWERGEAESRGGSQSKRTSSWAEKGSLDSEPQPSKLNSHYYSPMGGTSSQTKTNPPQSEMQGHPLCSQGEAESRSGSPSKRTSSRAEKGSLDSEPQPSKSNSRYYSPMGGTSSQTKTSPPQSEVQRREQGQAESRGGSPSKRTSSRAEKDSLDSEPQDQVQETAESGSCTTANGASSQTEAGSLESQLQTLRGSLHPLASQFLQAQEVVVRIAAQLLANDQPLRSSLPAAKPNLLEAIQRLRQQLSEQEELVFQLQERNRQLQSIQEQQTAHRLEENRQLQEQKEEVSRLLKEKHQVQEKLEDQEKLVSELLGKNGELLQELEEKDIRVSHLVQENDWLRQENARLQRSPGSQRWTSSSWPSSAPALTAFPVEVWTTGQTGGCEKDIVNDVSKFLVGLGISLQQEAYEEKSGRFLLLFCPVSSRVGSDTLCALAALNRVRKAVLVVLHHKPKGSTQEILDTQRQVQHEALVRTVHACYSIQDGFYPCEMNEAAVASVAKAIQEQRSS
uniref:putative uncharacterized protein DDB_G0271606 isoform X3 n=1 Tax=Podarcis muralis TaxID=64176 RepID=UPI0010A04301|nr:putative uncharacterized protein DDB_G0271606 isoform X3 [Podarcis muralis]